MPGCGGSASRPWSGPSCPTYSPPPRQRRELVVVDDGAVRNEQAGRARSFPEMTLQQRIEIGVHRPIEARSRVLFCDSRGLAWRTAPVRRGTLAGGLFHNVLFHREYAP